MGDISIKGSNSEILLRNKASAKIFKISDSISARNKASKEMFKKAKGLKKGGKV